MGGNDFDDFADLGGGIPSLPTVALAKHLGGLNGVGGHGSGLGGIGGDRLDGRGHLLGAGRHTLQVLADLLRGLRNRTRLGGRFLGIGGDLLAGRRQFLARAGHVLCILGDGQNHGFQAAVHLVDGRGRGRPVRRH